MIQIAELAYQASMLVWAVAGLVLLPLLAVCGGLVLFHKTRAYGGAASPCGCFRGSSAFRPGYLARPLRLARSGGSA